LKIYLVDGYRTAFGRFSCTLKDVSPVDLSVACSKPLLEKYKLTNRSIDHVLMANVLPSTTDTLYGARHVALKSGLAEETPAYNVNRLCGSGIQVLWDAFAMIKLNRASLVLTTGAENMSLAPHLIYGSRFGTKYGPLKTVDMLMDSLTDQYAGCPMGITAETLAQEYNLSREQVDDYAFLSHQKASQAYSKGFIQGELAPGYSMLTADEHVRFDAQRADLEKLRPSFKKDGVVTPANASGIVDGAASILVANEERLKAMGATPLAEIVDFTVVGVNPKTMGIGPVPAIKALLERTKLSLNDIDLIEINEAFAPQVLACQKALEIPNEKLNVWGGAIAYGHPLGASGVRIALTAARQMKETGAKYGIASACIGGGQGIAVLLQRPS
jgi:acetyl-CoA acyltransferase 2